MAMGMMVRAAVSVKGSLLGDKMARPADNVEIPPPAFGKHVYGRIRVTFHRDTKVSRVKNSGLGNRGEFRLRKNLLVSDVPGIAESDAHQAHVGAL